MKKIQLVGRHNIINPSTYRIHDDKGLRALGGIRFGNATEFNNSVNPLAKCHELRREFETQYPDFYADRYSIRFEDGNEIDATIN